MDRSKLKSNKITILILYVCFSTSFVIADKKTAQEPNLNICNTEACKNIASSILQKMNQSVDPCDNFYDFVCGNFTKNAVISPTSSTNNLLSQLRIKVRGNLRYDIENQITNKDPETFRKLLTYYETCMDENQIERTSSNEFMEILNKLGGWPVLLGKSYDDTKLNSIYTINKLRETGYSGDRIVKLHISSDLKNTTKNRIIIDQPEFGIAPEYLKQGLENEIVKAYFKFMIDMAEIFGANRNQAKLELGESLNFELELAKISLTNVEREDEEQIYNPMTISDLQNKYPIVSWLEYLNNWLSPLQVVTEEEVVIVAVPNFLQSLGSILRRTPKRVVANYVMWRVALTSANLLNQKVRDAHSELEAALEGKRKMSSRWETCVDMVADHLYLATSSLYARRHFDKATKAAVVHVLEQIRQSAKNNLLKVNWLDESTRSAALKKLDQLLYSVGYPDEVLDDKKIDDRYDNLKLIPSSFLKSFLNYNRFKTEKTIMRLRRPVPRIDWTNPDVASNVAEAYYEPLTNVMILTAAILQGEFYNKDYPKYVNFGAIGIVIGHEISHGFDAVGHKHDGTGNFVNWWSSGTEKKYLQKAQCVVDQYSNMTDRQVNLKINGNLTKNENIADNVGDKIAYEAYDAIEKETDMEPILPGFESFTPKQLFWISGANNLCTKYLDEELKDVILTDEHSPPRFRVIGKLSNSPYFTKDFNCPAGSPMNPVHKCSVF